MAKPDYAISVIATARGYAGGVLREVGDVFTWPEPVDPLKASWVEPHKARSPYVAPAKPDDDKGDDDKAVIDIPADWANGSAAARKALAKEISGANPPNAAEADKVIQAYIDEHPREAFQEAPKPEVAKPTSDLDKAIGGPAAAPDWVDPSGKPQAAAE
jgi:hypothetical protein